MRVPHLLAYCVLALGFLFSINQATNATDDVKTQAAHQSSALVASARQVVKDGCDRDNENQAHFRTLLKRLKESSTQSYKAGRVPVDQYKEAQTFYTEQLRVFSLADCDAAVAQITDKP